MRENPKFKGVILDANDNLIEGTEFTGWHSRSVAVVVIVTDRTHEHFLIEKRGPGCPDNIGKWVMPCGYINWDETLQEAAAREVYEETGLTVNPNELFMLGINDNPNEARQNITVRFICDYLSYEDLKRYIEDGSVNTDSKERGGEGGECEAIALASFEECKELEFAFGHDRLIKMVHYGAQ